MVVGVMLALVLGRSDRIGPDAYFQVVSGTSNPLPIHTMVDAVYEYFLAHPLADDRGRPIKIRRWTYRRGHLVEPAIALKEAGVRLAEGAATLVPRRNARKWAGTLHKSRAGLTTLRKFVELYKNYTRTELVFDDAHTRGLLAEIGGAEGIAFDVTAVEWHDYFTNHHLPGLVRLTAGYSAAKAAKRAASAVDADTPLPEASGGDVIAVFDLDGTVSSATVVTELLMLQRDLRGPVAQAGQLASVLWNTPRYLSTERRARSQFLRDFARRYAGLRADAVEDAVGGRYAVWLRGTVRAKAAERIAAHRAAGHRTVLVTGVPAPFVAPLADLFDEIVAAPLDVRDGVLTGYLAGVPIVDEARAAWLLRYAADHAVDLAASYGYGDSQADVTWLGRLGHPFAVDPDLGLYAEAKRNRWPVLDW